MNTPIAHTPSNHWSSTFNGLDGLRYALKQPVSWLIEFKKVNGELRQMVCTLNNQYINKHTPISIYKPPKVAKKAQENPFYEEEHRKRLEELAKTNLSVFDVDKKAWRSMKVENIISVNPANTSLND